ncbi:sulfate transporter 3.3 [Vigna angularis]|uniref:Sulfate transporter 3.3 n=1 Tax=Phaseolus angularis TaxID=3914 RepID=A0A8T0LAZ3_PHAAN|nr:sulfate transporter 3.3 [Vigna angularis]
MERSNSTMQTDFVEVTLEEGTSGFIKVHKVVPPPYKSSFQKFFAKVKEILFPDDPLRQFKGEPLQRKLILGAQYLFPLLQWVPTYNLKLFKSDLISGLTIASLAIPQGISYAKLANLPPIFGLYSSFVPPLVYVVLGSSMDLAVGPVSIASLVLGSMLNEEVSPTAESDLFLQLALTSTFFAGIFQSALGILRKMLCAIFAVVVANNSDGDLLLGVSAGCKTRAGAPLVSVIISTALSFAIKAQRHGISVIGKLPRGVNPPSADKLLFRGDHLPLAIKTGLITGILSLTEGIAVGRTFATMRNYKVDGNKEMMAIGFMNVVGSTTSCYVTTGSFSRSAINHNAGARTAMSNVVMSVTVLVTLLFLMPLFQYTPNVILGAIIISAVIGLIDIPSAYLIWKVDKFDFVVMLAAFFGVIFISVQIGLAVSVSSLFLQFLYSSAFLEFRLFNDKIQINQYVICGNFRIYRWVEEEQDTIKENVCLQFLILDMSAVSTIDTSGVSLFKDLKNALTMKGVSIVLVNPLAEVIDKLQKSDDANDFIRAEYLFLTVGEAVASLSSTMTRQTPTVQDARWNIPL